MRRKSIRIVMFCLLGLAGLIVLAGGVFYWRLSQGPVSLAFMTKSIEAGINTQLPGFRIALGETDLELDRESRTPHVRVRNLILADASGETIASAPKAGVALNTAALLRGNIAVESLDLIGPRINVRRNLDGSFRLGIGNGADVTSQDILVDPNAGPPDNAADAAAPAAPLISGSRILDLLDAGGVKGTLSKLQEVRLSRGTLQLYDEANDATWTAPRADLAFRRVPSGFVLAAKAHVASGGEPWSLESSITFRAEAKNYTANVAIDNLVPANVSDKIFALAQFARLNTPLSGNFQIEADEVGMLTKLEGQVFAAAGRVNLPEYLANPIVIDEGSLRIRQNGSGQPFELVESSILIGSSRADLKGTVTPRKAEDGRIVSYDVDLSASNVAVDTQGTAKDPVFVDRVAFKGGFGVELQRVDIEDLIVMAGDAGVRLRGVVTGGEESAGIQASGRLRDVNAALLKKLWPPILAPKTRNWINENVDAGVVSDAVFEINFPPDSLARAQASKVLPPDAVTLRFTMRDVVTRYFKSLPVLRGASGNAELKNGQFGLNIDNGFVVLPSGNRLSLAQGRFDADDLLAVAVPGRFRFDIQGGVKELLEFADSPDLNLLKDDFTKLPAVDGRARAIVNLALPLIKNVPREQVTVTQDISITNASLVNVLPGVDLTEGMFSIDVSKDTVTVAGPAKLNGVTARIDWRKPRNGGEASISVDTTLTASLRAKLGIRLDPYLSGDVPVSLSVANATRESRRIGVEADLSGASLRVASAGWSRAPTKGTTATFTLVDDPKGGRRVENLRIKGKGLEVSGSLSLASNNALRIIEFDEVRLAEADAFSVRVEPGEGATKVVLTGDSFDARPYIKNLLSSSKTPGESDTPKSGSFVINAKFKEVVAHRGEVIRNVSGRFETAAGRILAADVEGTFETGFPIKITLQPAAGGRELRVESSDGGSTLRAANFYSKVAGGQLDFRALMANTPGSPVRNGELTLRRFDVRNEPTLAELDARGKPKKSGPRVDGVSFKRLTMPFTADQRFVRLCDIELKGVDLGGVAQGVIRKSDGAMDVTGTMIPAQGINGLLDDIPLLNFFVTGGKGEGIFGITFAMGGTIKNPKIQVNPVSAVLPGFLRKFSEYRSSCSKQSMPPPRQESQSLNPSQN